MCFLQRLSRKKDAKASDVMATNLKRCLTSFDITLLGIGHMMGSGIYVVTPTIVRDTTGPAIIISYLIAGLASLLAALAYADFGVKYPRSGSAYSYIYYSIGEFWAFYVGWNVLLENVLATAACSSACSAYIDALTGNKIFDWTVSVTGRLPVGFWAEAPDFLAFIILMTFVVFMTFGVKATVGLTNTLVCLNMVVLTIVVAIGVRYANFDNWTYQPDNLNFNRTSSSNFISGFMPYGWSGVFRASASCFFAYVGFDAIAAAGEEALNPQKSLHVATMASMSIVTTVYVLVSGVLTLMVYFANIDRVSGLPGALAYHGEFWAQYLVSVGAIAGMSTVIMASVYAMTRICYAMAEDGLVFRIFAIVNGHTQTPLVSMYFFAVLSAIVACFLDINTIVEMLSIGTLMAYLLVACALVVSKYTPLEETIDLQLESANSCPKVTLSPKLTEAVPRASALHKNSPATVNKRNYLKPEFAFFGRVLFKDYSQRFLVNGIVVTVVVATLVACCTLRFASSGYGTLEWIIIALSLAIVLFCMLLLYAHEAPNNKKSSDNQYNMPLVPFLPVCSIVINTGLMTTLQVLTWVRLLVWVAIGFVIYFTYGIRHSRLNRVRS